MTPGRSIALIGSLRLVDRMRGATPHPKRKLRAIGLGRKPGSGEEAGEEAGQSEQGRNRMASKETKARIIETALTLFNEHGSANISTNRIATEAGISKGNLNYHYSNKKEIILDIFSDIRSEIEGGWSGDHLVPTLEHMEFMFLRQLRLTWRYRFFYREMVNLIKDDPLLGKRFNELRSRRRVALKQFLTSLADDGRMVLPESEEELEHFMTSTWLLSEHWLNYTDSLGRQVDEAALMRGCDVLMTMVRPYLKMLEAAECAAVA